MCTDTMVLKNNWMDKIRPLIKQAGGNEGIRGSVAGSAAVGGGDSTIDLPKGFLYGVPGPD